MTLADLSPGDCCRVVGVHGTDGLSIRLLEMGLIPGVDVKILGTALFGDPIELELHDFRLSVRRSEAALVEVALASAVSASS
jgi:Fe2+ transport system protein FeoA